MIEAYAYKKLSTEFYDLDKPFASVEEIDFYRTFLAKAQAPFLEIMCGSGRLLIPLLERGFEVEGVDNSPSMLASCRARAGARGLKPVLYEQSLEEVSLSKKYGAVFCAVGSFQLIIDKKIALGILKSLWHYVLPGGFILIDTFIPYELLSPSISLQNVFYAESHVRCSDGTMIRLHGKSVIDRGKKLFVTHQRYEKIKDDVILETEDEVIPIRWYEDDEFEELLMQAGFVNITQYKAPIVKDEETTLFQGFKN